MAPRKRKREKLSAAHKLAISLGLKKRSRGRGSRILGTTTAGKVARGAGVVAAGGTAAYLLSRRSKAAVKPIVPPSLSPATPLGQTAPTPRTGSGVSGTPGFSGKKTRFKIDDPWTGSYKPGYVIKNRFGRAAAAAGRDAGRLVGVGAGGAILGVVEGAGAAAYDMGKAYLPAAKRGGDLVKASINNNATRAKLSYAAVMGRQKQAFGRVKSSYEKGLKRDQQARQKLYQRVRRNIFGFSTGTSIASFSNTGNTLIPVSGIAEFRTGKPLSKAHKAKISRALKGKKRGGRSPDESEVESSGTARARSQQITASAWERGTQGLENLGRAYQVVSDANVKRRLAARTLGWGEVNRTARTIGMLGGSSGVRILGGKIAKRGVAQKILRLIP